MQIGLFTQILLPHNFCTFILFLLALVFLSPHKEQMLYSFVDANILMPLRSWSPQASSKSGHLSIGSCTHQPPTNFVFAVLHLRPSPSLMWNPFCLIELCDFSSLFPRKTILTSPILLRKWLGGRMCFLLTLRRDIDFPGINPVGLWVECV